MKTLAISPGLGRAGLQAWARRAGSADFLLVREKALAAADLTAACREVRAVAAPGLRVLVAGGRVDVALAAGLDGVHVGAGSGELRPKQIRCLLPGAWVSVSCHTVDEVRRARENEASAVLFAPVFGKVVKGIEVMQGVGLGALEEACRAAGAMPVFALGGVTPENVEACIQAGAAGIAAIRMFARADHPPETL